jgi:hypothetical protein
MVPPQPCLMPPRICGESNVFCSSSAALCVAQRTVKRVLPSPMSSKVNVESISSRPGRLQRTPGDATILVGEGVDEDELRGRRDLAIDELAPYRVAVPRFHRVVVGAAGAQIHLRLDHREALGPHQCFMCSTSVNTFQTRSRGALNTRDMTKSPLLAPAFMTVSLITSPRSSSSHRTCQPPCRSSARRKSC